MIKKNITLVAALLAVVSSNAAISNSTWIDQSNQMALEFTHSIGAIRPEEASAIGLAEYDRKATYITNDIDDKLLEVYRPWHNQLDIQVKRASDKNLKIDLAILKNYVKHQIRQLELSRQYQIVPFESGSLTIFQNINVLMNNQSSLQSKTDAVDRFKAYVSPENGLPYLEAYEAYTESKINTYNAEKTIYPLREQVEEYLSNSSVYVTGVKQLLEASPRQDWHDDFKKFEQQVAAYDNYVRTTILPKAATTPGLPELLYVQKLQEYGMTNNTPEQMIADGKLAYAKEYREYVRLAGAIAEKYGLLNRTPKAVIDYLKKDKVTTVEDVLALYMESAYKLQDIILQNELLTLPDEDLRIRVASAAESKQLPAPNLYCPPYLRATDMLPEFVVPVAEDKLLYDDFAYRAIALDLTAHEGRPGHEVHVRQALASPSIIRGTYAVNAANHEGWALYAEGLIYPFATLEEQFTMLQMRLLRIARFFLDPMVQLGQANEETVIDALHNHLGLSKELATIEYKRYAYIFPAQATAYYQGLLNIYTFKNSLEEEYGPLNLQCFNDTLLTLGFMPQYYFSEFKEKFLKCSNIISLPLKMI